MIPKLRTSFRRIRERALAPPDHGRLLALVEKEVRTAFPERMAAISEDNHLKTFAVTYSDSYEQLKMLTLTFSNDRMTTLTASQLKNTQLWMWINHHLVSSERFAEPPPSRFTRPVHFLLEIAVWLLSSWERARYLEEFRAELLDVPDDTRLRHALSLLRGVFVLRLRRGSKNKAAGAAARRARD